MGLFRTAFGAGLSVTAWACNQKEGKTIPKEERVFKKAFDKLYTDFPEWIEYENKEEFWSKVSSFKIFEKFSPYAPEQDTELWWEVVLGYWRTIDRDLRISHRDDEEKSQATVKNFWGMMGKILEDKKNKITLRDTLEQRKGKLNLKFTSPLWEELVKSRNLKDLMGRDRIAIFDELFDYICFFEIENLETLGVFEIDCRWKSWVCVNWKRNLKTLTEEQKREIATFFENIIMAFSECPAFSFRCDDMDDEIADFLKNIFEKVSKSNANFKDFDFLKHTKEVLFKSRSV